MSYHANTFASEAPQQVPVCNKELVTAADSSSGPAECAGGRRCRLRMLALWVGSLCLATSLATFFVCRILHAGAAEKQGIAAQHQEFLEKLYDAAELGIIQVDWEKLNEMICIVTEARWAEETSPDSESCPLKSQP
jgi:hypothetical protein